ncbi:MAG: hypothetical protein JNN07_26615 [Verrucomicrobiales bacterium]|nr:hypothetical protein [Verrucomicrobiales bacterium]
MKNSPLEQLNVLTAVLSFQSWALFAATLTAVPMKGGMVIPMLSYQAAEGRMHVMVDATVPQLMPLWVSDPGDSFDPGDPWFEALDPSWESQSFSRRYGFVMDAVTDPLPVGTQMGIRKLCGTLVLSVYRYANTAPKAFAPIFRTDGTTNALHWNGMMFHPTFTAPSGTNTYTATFKAYLLITGTGLELPNSSTGPFVSAGRTCQMVGPFLALSGASWSSGGQRPLAMCWRAQTPCRAERGHS